MNNSSNDIIDENVDEYEIAKFEALAARWWDKNSEFKPLHDINPLRLNYIDDHAKLNGKSVLDIGCGGGILAESMAAKGANVDGIDLGNAPLKVAELHALESGIEVNYERISAENYALKKPAHFDVVTCMEMLEHVPDPASIIAASYALVKPGGAVFFSTINRNPKSYLYAIVAAEYLLSLLPRGTHEYNKFIRPSEMAQWVRQSKLKLRQFVGISYNPLTKRYHLDKTLDVNYIAYTVRESE